MIRTLYRHRSGTLLTDITGEQLSNAARDPQSRLWVDMQAPTPDEYELILRKLFKFHPLSIKDTINEVHIPKIDNYNQYLYLVFHTFRMGDERMDIDTFEIDVFLGPNYLITLHSNESPAIEKMWDTNYHQSQGLALGPAMLLYEMLDSQVDAYIPLLDQFEMQIEELGDIIFHPSNRDDNRILDDILTAKSSALRLRRILLPQREVLSRLAHNDYSVIPNETRIYFQDVYDHVFRLADLADGMRDTPVWQQHLPAIL